ncbi:hypothetical protein [Rhizobium leguminosarum]|uniref:hypothetical protein n=1 Tax=Rhizobium leguminosarum TaxID=384 RepID=UPI00131A40A7|nr:hypothetical protein [Rhizobium leguminosarum]
MSGHSFSLAVIGDWRMLPRREATKICHALWGRTVVSLGIFEIVPEDRYPSREDRDRNQPKLDVDGFDDMKLHITEAEEVSPTQGDAEDYGYRFPCPRSCVTSPYFPRAGPSHSH